MMQHGSILLRRSPHAPNLPGIAELSGVNLEGQELVEACVVEFATETGWTIQPSNWSDAERALADELNRTKYSAAEWNEKR